MSFVFETPRALSTDTFVGGEGSLGDIFSAGIDQMLYVDNSFASHDAMHEAYDRRIDEVFSATGVKLSNPIFDGPFGNPVRLRDELFMEQVAQATKNLPDTTVADRLMRNVEGDAIAIARASDQRLANLMESRAGLGKWVAGFAGGMTGALRDPITLGSLFIGGGVGAGRTVAARILSTATREALVNAGTEAAVQPLVQGWRRKAGLDSGFDQAVANVAFAGALGGFIGAGGRGAVELLARVPPRARAAAEGDLPAARELLPEIRDALKPSARGALDHVETLDMLERLRPRATSPEIHERAVTAAHRASEPAAISEPAPITMPEPEPARVAAIVDELAGDSLSLPEPDPKVQSLVEFLRAKGGVLDQGGELRALGADALARKRGRTDQRLPLDTARELAEEAGYIGRAGETQVTTVPDLLDAIDRELRGAKIYARDADPVARADIEAERARMESTVSQILREAGPGIDDGLVRQAAELSLREGTDPLDALERLAVQDEQTVRVVRGFRDTRGDGVQYNGTGAEISDFHEGHYGRMNYYGQGFYTTDAIDIANGYANRRGATKPTVYRVTERGDLTMFDMEEPTPSWLVGRLDEWPDADQELLELALAENPASTRQLYDEIRALSRSVDMPADDVQELFNALRDRLEAKGYAGLEHTGGLRTGNDPHRVRIYFNPDKAVSIEKIDPVSFRVNAGERSGDPLPGWSDEELLAASETRGIEPDAEGGLSRPGEVADDMVIDRAEIDEFAGIEIVGDDGRVLTLSAYMDEIQADDDAIALLNACKV